MTSKDLEYSIWLKDFWSFIFILVHVFPTSCDRRPDLEKISGVFLCFLDLLIYFFLSPWTSLQFASSALNRVIAPSKEFLNLAHQATFPDDCLCSFLIAGLNTTTRAQLSGEGPRGSLVEFLSCLVDCRSPSNPSMTTPAPLTIQCPAKTTQSVRFGSKSPTQKARLTPLQRLSLCPQERPSWTSQRSLSTTCARCASRLHHLSQREC